MHSAPPLHRCYVFAYTASSRRQILSVGNEPYVYHWKKQGKLEARVKASSSSLFAVAVSKSATSPVRRLVLRAPCRLALALTVLFVSLAVRAGDRCQRLQRAH